MIGNIIIFALVIIVICVVDFSVIFLDEGTIVLLYGAESDNSAESSEGTGQEEQDDSSDSDPPDVDDKEMDLENILEENDTSSSNSNMEWEITPEEDFDSVDILTDLESSPDDLDPNKFISEIYESVGGYHE